MSLSRKTIGLYMALVFASGAAIGVFGNRYYEAAQQSNAPQTKGKRPPTPDEFRKMYLSNMREKLLLSDEQVQKLTAILDETRSQMNDLHKRQLPAQQEIQKQQQDKIRALMDSVQLEKYEAMMKRLADRAKANKAKQNNGN